MKYIAVFSMEIGNTFLRLELENTDGDVHAMEDCAEELAQRLGGRFLYLEAATE